jgi:hypothetical protein
MQHGLRFCRLHIESTDKLEIYLARDPITYRRAHGDSSHHALRDAQKTPVATCSAPSRVLHPMSSLPWPNTCLFCHLCSPFFRSRPHLHPIPSHPPPLCSALLQCAIARAATSSSRTEGAPSRGCTLALNNLTLRVTLAISFHNSSSFNLHFLRHPPSPYNYLLPSLAFSRYPHFPLFPPFSSSISHSVSLSFNLYANFTPPFRLLRRPPRTSPPKTIMTTRVICREFSLSRIIPLYFFSRYSTRFYGSSPWNSSRLCGCAASGRPVALLPRPRSRSALVSFRCSLFLQFIDLLRFASSICFGQRAARRLFLPGSLRPDALPDAIYDAMRCSYYPMRTLTEYLSQASSPPAMLTYSHVLRTSTVIMGTWPFIILRDF